MGFDTSYHPIDVRFFHERLFPFVRGEGSIDDLVEAAVRTAKVRFRANAWGLGLAKLRSESVSRRAKERKPAPPPKKPGAFARLFGKAPPAAPPPPEPLPPDPELGELDSQLHVWGRPFLIGGHTSAEVSAAIDQYSRAAPDAVDAMAAEAIRQIAPALAAKVVPDGAVLPPDADIARGIRWKMDLFRDAHSALAAGGKVALPSGEQGDPGELFATAFAFAALQFACHFRPGWMARGIWPSRLVEEAGLALPAWWETPAPLFEPLLAKLPRIGEHFDRTIQENYTLGGYVRPEHVGELKQFLHDHRGELAGPAKRDGWLDDCERELRKIEEALDDALLRKAGFCEATEVYSGPLGVMN